MSKKFYNADNRLEHLRHIYGYKSICGILLKGTCTAADCCFPTQLGYLECEMSLELWQDWQLPF